MPMEMVNTLLWLDVKPVEQMAKPISEAGPKKNIITCFGSCLKKKQHCRNIYDLKPKVTIKILLWFINWLA
uniref:Uncharacterized protein n=1 Tax=Triticum urartu TaxID=4572 RepID=A0A8R7UZW9_TRIUA